MRPVAQQAWGVNHKSSSAATMRPASISAHQVPLQVPMHIPCLPLLPVADTTAGSCPYDATGASAAAAAEREAASRKVVPAGSAMRKRASVTEGLGEEVGRRVTFA